MPTYIITNREGPSDSLWNADKSTIQISSRTWSFSASCSVHPQGHSATVADPYAPADVQAYIEKACVNTPAPAPEVGQTWTSK